MKTCRRGIQLVEIVVALGLLAGPLLCTLHLVVTNIGRAQLTGERAIGQLLLLDAMELLRADTPAEMRRLAGPGIAGLRARLSLRLDELPAEQRSDAAARSRPLLARLTATLDETTGVNGLARLVLRLTLLGGQEVKLMRLVRTRV